MQDLPKITRLALSDFLRRLQFPSDCKPLGWDVPERAPDVVQLERLKRQAGDRRFQELATSLMINKPATLNMA